MSKSMSDEFDSLDGTEKAAVEGALNNAKRPSDDVVQTAPVKCRYKKSGICANIAGFCLCRQANLRSPRDDCRLCHNSWTNKCLAQSNKSRTGCEANKKRESSVSLQAKRDDKRRASGRSDLPSDDVGLHRRRGGLRRDRVTP